MASSSDDSSSVENLSNGVTHPVTPPPQPPNEGHEAEDVGELIQNTSDNAIATEDSSSISSTLRDAVVANRSGDVTPVDAASSVPVPDTPTSQPHTEAHVDANLDNGGDVADGNRGGGRPSRGRRKTVLLHTGISCHFVGFKYGAYKNRHVVDEDQCDDADEDDTDDADEDDTDDADEDDTDDLDDELNPRSVSKKIKRDRMRKTAERGFTKRG